MSAPLKPPVWTWEVPAYFFAGGVAGVSAAIAFAASLDGGHATVERAARWIAAGGAGVSPLLLVSDLGRPSRFLYMLRVFKRRSAMSVGAWTLVVFSAAVFGGLALSFGGQAPAAAAALRLTLDAVAAASGLLLATYTGVLLGATVVPAWASRHRWLPIEFGVSSLGAAASLIELAGGTGAPMHRAALAAAAIETAAFAIDRAARRRPSAPSGAAPPLLTWALAVSGPMALGLRLLSNLLPAIRPAAAVAAVAGSLAMRFGWIAAGRASVAAMRK
jgi:formate-dependent nitrite reductase membrane component NrfD